MENEKKIVQGEQSVGEAKTTAPEQVCEQAGEQGENIPQNGMKKRRMSKQLLAVIISVSLVLVILGTVLIVNLVRNRRPPDLESVRARFEELVDASFEVNEVLFGNGPATYPRVNVTLCDHDVEFWGDTHTIYYKIFRDDSVGIVVAYWYYVVIPETHGEETSYVAYDILSGEMIGSAGYEKYRYAEKSTEEREGYIYHDKKSGYYYYPLEGYVEPTFSYGDGDEEEYDYVMLEEKYQSVEEIRAAAEAVYSASYLSAVYEGLFTGIAFSDQTNGVLFARYRNHEKDGVSYLQKCNLVEALVLPQRRYDYSTMRIAQGSKAAYVLVEMESYIVGKEEERSTVKLAFARENGVWYLDGPTY